MNDYKRSQRKYQRSSAVKYNSLGAHIHRQWGQYQEESAAHLKECCTATKGAHISAESRQLLLEECGAAGVIVDERHILCTQHERHGGWVVWVRVMGQG